MINIYNDDCLKKLEELKLDKKVNLVLADLPYGQTACKWDTKIDHEKMWGIFKKVCSNDCVYLFFCTTRFGHELINSNKKWFRYDLVWKKSLKAGFLNCKIMPLREHEMIYVFKKFKGTYNPIKTKGKYRKSCIRKPTNNVYGDTKSYKYNGGDMYYPASVLDFPNPNHKNIHKTQKPNTILEYLIKTYSNEGDLVLDPTMGSGSTGVACINTSRNFIGIEKDEVIFKKAKHHIFKHELIKKLS
jgi:site-specific DNA-methyltransferase (adenine-specific)